MFFPEKCAIGFEFSGREEMSGKRLCGFASSQAIATSILREPKFCIEIPDNWSLEEAATIPIVYTTCYYCFFTRARLQPRESVLIHSGTGGVGLAAINIALRLNCEIFVTVGTEEKKRYLKKKFPQIKEENIGCSRNTSFELLIMERTHGKGVDVVLNSLADDKFQASIRCIAKNGRFIEIGRYDLSLNREIGLKIFLKSISFHAVELDDLLDSEEILPVLRMIQDDMRTGAIKPLDRTLFDRNSVEDAFKYMTKGIHVGKILLKIRDEETEAYNIPKRFMLPAVLDTHFYYNKVYIIIGGLGGFGMEVTKWMIRKGAKNLILTSRYGIRTSYHHFRLKKWQTQGINVQVSTLNASIKSEAETLLRNASCIAPVGGIFNSAMVLNDAFMNCQTPDTFKKVCAPKADATVYLDELTRKLCPSLDYFICFSSVSCGRGNAGQTNYGYANSVMDRICEERKNAGLHGLSIQWGIIGEVGKAQRDFGTDFTMNGLMAQSVHSCLEALDIFCQQDNPVVTSYVTSELTQKADQKNKMSQFIKILGYDDMSQIDTKRNLGEMGLDSFIKVETKDFIEFHSGSILSLQEIQGMNLEDIKALLDKSDRETDMQQVSTKDIKLPPTLLFKDPIITINKDAPGEPIFILDIGDVDVNNFQSIAKAINRPVHALVWTKETAFTDMKTLASWYLKIIQKPMTKESFSIVGHFIG
ncbi:fatty acid synthase [Nephila pilipes]|uniref:Fatty acid synthase n=1 Tax=Nephila pilipes TaxID=299642 RepID=A0A8X6UM85_NEPPI|nr:fatty acid synthase [Nephila pilipes]